MGGIPPSAGLTPCVLWLGKSHVISEEFQATTRALTLECGVRLPWARANWSKVQVRHMECVWHMKLVSGLNHPPTRSLSGDTAKREPGQDMMTSTSTTYKVFLEWFGGYNSSVTNFSRENSIYYVNNTTSPTCLETERTMERSFCQRAMWKTNIVFLLAKRNCSLKPINLLRWLGKCNCIEHKHRYLPLSFVKWKNTKAAKQQ